MGRELTFISWSYSIYVKEVSSTETFVGGSFEVSSSSEESSRHETFLAQLGLASSSSRGFSACASTSSSLESKVTFLDFLGYLVAEIILLSSPSSWLSSSSKSADSLASIAAILFLVSVINHP